MKTGRFKRQMRRVLALVLCICMLSTLLCDAAFAADVSQTYFIVRHWHADGSADEVTGYIDSDGVHIGTNTTDAPYTVTPNPKTYTVTSALGETVDVKERFTSFSVSAGSGAVTLSGENAFIEYSPYIPTVKVHVFYSLDGNTLGYSFGEAGLTKDPEKDVVTVTADDITNNQFPALALTDENIGARIYDTSEGLHTNKTATATADDGRTFNLTLESWYAGENLADVGLILDASGSMAFLTTDTLTSGELGEYDETRISSVSSELPQDKLLTQEQVDRLLDQTLTDNSPLSYSDYTYYIYDPRDTTMEYVPLGYWDGNTEATGKESTLTGGLVGMFQFDSTDNEAFRTNGATGNPVKDDSVYSSAKSSGDFKKESSSSSSVTPAAGSFRAYKEGGGNSTLDLEVSVDDPSAFTVSFALKT